MNKKNKNIPGILKKFILIFIFTIVNSTLLFPQSSADSLDYIPISNSVNLLSTYLDKQINTYSLNTGFAYTKDINNFNFKVYENFNSKLVKSSTNNRRDEQNFTLSTTYKVSPAVSSGILVENKILSDNRQIEINQASVSNVSLFTLYSPEPGMVFSPFVGYSNNRQIGENDYGLIYGIEGSTNETDLSDLNLNAQLKLSNEDISPRKNLLRYLDLLLSSNFTNNVSNTLSARFTQNRKDFYYAADQQIASEFNIINNIQSRIETAYSLEDNVRFGNFFNIFTLNSRGNVSWRDIDRDTRYRPSIITSSSVYDTKINELRVEFESAISYKSDFFSGIVRGLITERDEKNITKSYGNNDFFFEERSNQESQKNNNSTRASLSFSGDFNFSKKDKLSLSFLQNKLRYDTPSEENFDDRDEILSILRLRYSRFLTPFFEAFVSTEGTYSHIVYLFSEKSSNNNINRVLKFAAGGNYAGKNVSSLNTFEVSANYTVYDFEDLNPNFKSFSFRQFTATDSSSVKIFKDLSLENDGYLKLSEQGDFQWSSFSAQPTRYLEEIYAEPKISYNLNGILLASGIRYFSLKAYNYSGREKIPDSKYISIGPLMEIFFLINQTLYFRLYGWYEFINASNAANREQANFTMQMNWKF